MFAGTVMDGGSVSFTVTRNDFDVVLFEVSVAVHVTVVVPSGNAVPEGGLQLKVSPG